MPVSCRYAEAATDDRTAEPEHKSGTVSVNDRAYRHIVR
jgi:hypothetical protein